MENSKNTSKKKVLVLSTIQGHASLAQAVEENLSDDFEVNIFCHPDPTLYFYKIIYRYAPRLMSFIFSIMNFNVVNKMVCFYLQHKYKNILFFELNSYHPDIIISVNYAFDPVIEKYRKSVSLPYINIMPDPRTFYKFSVSSTADINFVFDKQQKVKCDQLKPQANNVVLGWLCRKNFYNKPNMIFNHDPKNIVNMLFIGGSEGTEKIYEVIKKILIASPQVLCFVVTGKNNKLFTKINKLIHQYPSSKAKIDLIGWTDKLYSYVKHCNLVVGKAGPNSVFESVAAGKPYFAITHIGGLENGNLEIIKDYQIGMVEENTNIAIQKILNLIDNPNVLNSFQDNITKLQKYNLNAENILKEKVAQLLRG